MKIYQENFISIVIPAYNESKRILKTLVTIDEYMKDTSKVYEIIVVNDGSQDNTSEIILKAKAKIKNLSLIEYETNMGKGHAVRKGVYLSEGNVIFISDADMSTPIEELEKLYTQLKNGYDIVIGSRGLPESNIVVKQPWWRQGMGKIFNRLFRVLFSEELMDTQCGFKLFKGDSCRDIFGQAKVNRFAYDVEIIQIARRSGYLIKEVPIKWINSSDSRVNAIKDSLQMLKDLLKIRLRRL